MLLRTFEAVIRAGSFSGAARALACVQSNITARIRRLEGHYGQPLFDRGKGGASLTPLGERLHAHAVDLLARLDAVERDMLDASGAAAGLRLGAMETTAAGRLPRLLAALRAAHPAAPVSLAAGPTGELLADVWARRLDAALVAGPVDTDRFRGVEAFRERLVLVRPVEGAAGPLLAFRRSCSYRGAAEAWLRATGRADTEIVELGTLDGMIGCVEAGMGIAVLPEQVVAPRAGPGLAVDPLPDAIADTVTHLVWRLDHRPSRVHETLVGLIAGQAPTGAPCASRPAT
ncbi:MAG: LysR family transcriptional regulator [Pseudomonadota bacterium]